MKFFKTHLPGLVVVELEPIADERGFFARSWCRDEFAEQGLEMEVVQCNVSYNRERGTLRGMHLQRSPHAEAKLVRCTRGAICDVVVDLRPDSPAYLKHCAMNLAADNYTMAYVPEGCAHGFQTLTDETEVFYQMSAPYVPESAVGYRWDDPSFGIEWPLPITVISERDGAYPDYQLDRSNHDLGD